MTSADDVRQEPVAAINGFRTRHHRARRAGVRRHVVTLTGPSPRSFHGKLLVFAQLPFGKLKMPSQYTMHCNSLLGLTLRHISRWNHSMGMEHWR
jgi:hypothetical protein